MKKTVFAILIALSSSIALSVAQPANKGGERHAKDPKQAQVAIAKRVAEMKVRLSLSDKQAAQMAEIFTQAHAERIAQAEAMRARAIRERDEMKVKRERQKAQLDAVLTPAQKEELVKMNWKASRGKFHQNGVCDVKKSAFGHGSIHQAKGKGHAKGECHACSCKQIATPHHGEFKHKGAHKGTATSKMPAEVVISK